MGLLFGLTGLGSASAAVVLPVRAGLEIAVGHASAVVGGIGDALGIPGALAVLAALPAAGLLILLPSLERNRPVTALDPHEVTGG